MSDNPLEALAEYLDANLPGVNTYGWAADSVKAPAIVLTPASPFQAPFDQGGPSNVLWAIDINILVSRSQPKYALRKLYELRRSITDLLTGAPDTTRWISFDDINTTTIGDIDLLGGALMVTIISPEV